MPGGGIGSFIVPVLILIIIVYFVVFRSRKKHLAGTKAHEGQYWLERDGDVRGPYSFEILTMMWARKELRLLDRIREEGTESWIEVTRVVRSLEQAAHAQSDEAKSPPPFGLIVFLTALLPIIGLIVGVVWLLQPRYRSAGVALLAIFVMFTLIWYAILFH
jgi:hypothetical protein